MARTIAPHTPAEETPDARILTAEARAALGGSDDNGAAFFEQAAQMAARVVALIGAKRTTQAFIEDEDLTELAPDIADFLQGDAMPSEESARIGQMVGAKLTKEEWRLYDRAESAQNAHAVALLEAGILIGVELERTRQLHNLDATSLQTGGE